MAKLSQNDIRFWLRYWSRSMVRIDEIRSLEDVAEARRFCSCMRGGIFYPTEVSDQQIWDALCAQRALEASEDAA